MEDTEKYTIKPGTQSGAKVHLRGKGFPSVKNAKVLGDMIVILKVVVPKDLTDKQKSILMEFEQSIGEGHDEHKEGFFDKIKKTFK
jgi:molecular chaperone DnaJ